MRRVRLQGEVDRPPLDLDIRAGAQMVFDVARALHVVRLERRAAEFAEHRRERLAHDVDQRIEPAPVRHPDHHLDHAAPGRRVDHGVQRRDGDLGALQPEPLRADVALLAERLEAFRLGQLLQDRPLLARVIGADPRRALDPPLDPGLLVGVLDVHELHPDRPAIARAHDGDDFVDGRRLPPQDAVDEDRPVAVPGPEAVGGRVELRMRVRHLQPERVERRLQMAAHAVGADQHQRPQAVGGRRPDLLRGRAGGGGGPPSRPSSAPAPAPRRCNAGRPGRARCVLQHAAGLVVQGGEQRGEALVDAAGVRHPARIQVGDERRVRAAESRCNDVEARHVVFL